MPIAPPYAPELDTLEFGVEVALKKYLLSLAIPAVNIYTGEETEERVLPAIACCCHGGPENPHGSNNYLEDVTVCVISNVDETNSNADPFPAHRRLVKAVKYGLWDSLMGANAIEYLHAVLSAQVPNLIVQREIEFEGMELTIRERKMETEFRFKMQCYAGPNGVV